MDENVKTEEGTPHTNADEYFSTSMGKNTIPYRIKISYPHSWEKFWNVGKLTELDALPV